MENLVPHFIEFTLTRDQVQHAGIVFSGILLFICILSKLIVKEEKKLAWVISLVNAGLLSVIGIVYAVIKTRSYHWKALTFQPGGRDEFHNIDNVIALTCLWFALANATDLIFGFLFYRKYMQILSGWVHHIIFIWIMYSCTTGDGIFLTVTPYAATFGMSLLEEIPTFVLALGVIFPSFRSDLGFGVTFFLFRILYHLYLLSAGWYAGNELIVRVLHCLTFALHVSWFMAWRKNYAGYKKAASSQDKKAE